MTKEHVAAMLRWAFPLTILPADRFMMVVEVDGYFDESGTHSSSNAVVVAGYLARAERWLEFAARWQDALLEFGVDCFHMADFVGRRSPFDREDWTGEQGETRFRRLAGIVNQAAEWGVGIAIPRATLDGLIPDKKKQPSYAYALAAVFCTLDAGRFLRGTYPNSQLRLTFDRGTEGRGELGNHIEDMVDSVIGQQAVPLLGSPHFENKVKFLPLQAADILAHSLYRDWCGRSTYSAIIETPVCWSVLDENEVAACSTLFDLWWLSYGKPRRSLAPSPSPPLPERLRPQGIIIRYDEASRSKKSRT